MILKSSKKYWKVRSREMLKSMKSCSISSASSLLGGVVAADMDDSAGSGGQVR